MNSFPLGIPVAFQEGLFVTANIDFIASESLKQKKNPDVNSATIVILYYPYSNRVFRKPALVC